MKNKKINVKMMAIILLICSNIIFILINLKGKNQSIEKQISSKGQLEETNDNNAYISMETHISELNEKQQEIENIQNISGKTTATADQILKDYTAYKDGKLITGTMEDRGAWTNTPTASGKVTIPAGYHNGSGYVDTSNAYTNGYNAGIIDQIGDGTVHTAVFSEYAKSKTQSYTIQENGTYILSICSAVSIVSSNGSVSITVNDTTVSYKLNQIITDPDDAFKLCYALSNNLELNKGDVVKFITTGTASYSTKGQIGTVIKL